ncbi:peroxiredoxin [Hippea maritima]|uniref:Putative peroxiredoxin bcp n=1 Tax=Hippea maritima (strain ATCC 700847 / DSM 10411 / MH2) TaxID=760142 RepID=F2LTZ0_HIPMA|nr:peroxiredoxin [Hippea maritima]AEA33389.1 alkyl hydroperoxide reductase/ Thiol specific antioxidant/ Mal allergen [Hippea maritima DSM 10411]
MKKAIDFCLPDHENKQHCLDEFKGKWIVLYFYPKDNTSGCTKEAVEFSQKKDAFDKFDAVIIGISKDSPKSHARFIEKHDLNILLLSDEEHKVLEAYGAWGKKKNYGKEYYGTIRSTFLIDPELNIVKGWKNVRVSGHVDKVLQELENLNNQTINKTEAVSEESVIELLKDKPLKTNDLANMLNADKKEIEKLIRKLKKEGKIESPKRCYYQAKEV